MLKVCTLLGGFAAVAALGLAGCGKPENTAYTDRPMDEAARAALATPLPPAPAWAASVIGRPVSAIAKGSTTCKGAIDVTLKHAARQPGDEIQGWAWDRQGKQPLARLLLTDPSAKVIGAGEVNRDRPDVPKAVAEVKSSKVGWTIVTRSTLGVATVMGLSSTGAICTLGPAQLS